MFHSALKQNQIRERLDFILNRLLIVFFFFILSVYASREIVDLDLWLHLKTGRYILDTHRVPSADIFSFTIPGKPWINHEWLFQVCTYLFYTKGPDGLILMQNAVLLLTFLLLFVLGRRSNNYIFIFTILYLALLTCAYRFTIRPDIFSFLFLMLYLCILKDFTLKKTPLVWLLPFIQVLWVNIHGFSFTGPLIVLIFLVGELFKRSVRLPYAWNQTNRLDDEQMTRLLILLGLVILASLVNPYGLRGAAYPLSVLGQISGKGRIVFQYIQELAKPVTLKNVFDINFFLNYKAFIFISLFSFRYNRRHIDISDALLWIFFVSFSLLAVRNVAYFGLVAAYIIFNNAELAHKNHKELPALLQRKDLRIIFGYVFTAILFFYPAQGVLKSFRSASYNFNTYELKSGLWGFSETRFPEKAVDFLLKYPFPKRMLNDFNSGSYLIGRAFPERLVFIDGRTELYGPDFFAEYVSLGEGKKSAIEKTISKYDIKGFFLTISTDDLHQGLARYLLSDPLWKVVYFDERAIILLKNTPENADLIKKFRIDFKDWKPPKPDLLKIGIVFRYPFGYLNRARFLDRMELYDASAREARIVLELSPNNGEAFKFLSNYYYQNKDYKKAYAYARNSLIFSSGDLTMRAKLALIYYRLGEEEKAHKVIDAIIKKQPKFAEGFHTKALIIKEKAPGEAIALLKQAIKLNSKNPRYHQEAGDLLAKKGDMSGAREEWKKAFEYDSANPDLKQKLGL